MTASRIYFATALCLSFFVVEATNVRAGVINGDFSDPIPLFGYTATGSTVSEPTGEFAQLATDTGFIRTLEQTFDTPSVPSVLSFDFAFSTTATAGAVPVFPDSFAVSLLTTPDNDFLDILVVDTFGPFSAIGAFIDPSVSIPGFVGLGGTDFSGRVSLELPSAVLGESATIFFDLFDNELTFDSIAAVDNITLTPSVNPIPEPSSLAIWGACLFSGLAIRRRRRR